MSEKLTNWPPKFTFAWRGVLIRLAGYYEGSKPEGPELLELLAAYLEESPVTTDAFIEWAKKREESAGLERFREQLQTGGETHAE